jgi:hypothetical protein
MMARVKNFYHDEICGRDPPDEPNIGICVGCLEDAILVDGKYCEQCADLSRRYQSAPA